MYTYTTTAQEEKGLVFAVAQANAVLPKGQIPYTTASYFAARVRDFCRSYLKAMEVNTEATLIKDFQQISPANQAEILAFVKSKKGQ